MNDTCGFSFRCPFIRRLSNIYRVSSLCFSATLNRERVKWLKLIFSAPFTRYVPPFISCVQVFCILNSVFSIHSVFFSMYSQPQKFTDHVSASQTACQPHLAVPSTAELWAGNWPCYSRVYQLSAAAQCVVSSLFSRNVRISSHASTFKAIAACIGQSVVGWISVCAKGCD